jgi:hypothetical protein
MAVSADQRAWVARVLGIAEGAAPSANATVSFEAARQAWAAACDKAAAASSAFESALKEALPDNVRGFEGILASYRDELDAALQDAAGTGASAAKVGTLVDALRDEMAGDALLAYLDGHGVGVLPSLTGGLDQVERAVKP